jgi:hypothetical protein
MRNRVISVVVGCGLLLASCGTEGPADGPGGGPTLTVGKRSLELAPAVGWTLEPRFSAHALELRNKHGHATVLMEQRADAADARRRLDEIAAEGGTAEFVDFGGNRGLRRVRNVRALQPSAATASVDPAERPLLTVAVAVGASIVRADAIATNDDVTAIEEDVISWLRAARSGAAVELPGKPVRSSPSRSALPAPQQLRTPSDIAQKTSDSRPFFEQGGVRPGEFSFADSALPGFNGAINSGAGVDAEIEVAVSADGRHIVVANNSRDFITSNNFGQSFAAPSLPMGGPTANGDPSLAWGPSGNFYLAYIAFPNDGMGNVTCGTGIHASVDDGQTFNFQGLAFVAPAVGVNTTFPDQEHIATDRVNASTGGGDMVYSAWRDFSPVSPSATQTCTGISSGFVTPSIVCSSDSGVTWSARTPITGLSGGDFPRLTVGPDGFVYVAFMSGNNGDDVTLAKFSSCDAGLALQAGFPVTVAAGVGKVNCGPGGVPGLNRCNDGNDLRSPTVAVDENDATHVFVAYASNSAADNEDVFIADSINGGTSFRTPQQVNAGVTGHRFMPWVCATGGTAFVSWYDQRQGVTGASNDLTDFYGATAARDGMGNLVANPEFAISEATDALCAAGWTDGPRSQNDSENCSVQPQPAGICSGSAIRCDFSDCAGPSAACTCPMGSTCGTSNGSPPKYGDYNGAACAAGRFYAAWASATAPVGDPAPNNIDVFFACPPDADDFSGTFADTTAPIFDFVPPDIFSNTCDVGPIGDAVAFDICGAAAPMVDDDAPDTFPPTSTTVTYTAEDAAGNVATATQTVLVVDTTDPVFTFVPPDISSSSCGAINIGTATAADDCEGLVSVTNDAPAQFRAGTTIVTWTATDAAGNSVTATQRVAVALRDDPACCPVGTNVILGNSNNNVLNGTTGADCILGRGAQDTINGNGGDDFISGGDGNDNINGGGGNDTIFAGSGQDIVNGGNENDTLDGGDGDDSVIGGSGDDSLSGGQGQDSLQGQDGNDDLFGGTGDDQLLGGNGNDDLVGGTGNDNCNGGANSNTFAQCEFGAPNSCVDGAQNGTETGLDCGGACTDCGAGAACVSGSDCDGGLFCVGGICTVDSDGGTEGLVVTEITFTTDWGGGYCAVLNVTNNATSATTGFGVTLNTNASTIYTSWEGTFSGMSGVITVTPDAEHAVLDPDETESDIGFCANRSVSGSGTQPFVVSTTGTF